MATRKTTIIRTGGLGDFILTLPLLHALGRRGDEVTCITRMGYARLAADDAPGVAFGDVDGPDFLSLTTTPTARARQWFEQAEVLSFWPDHDGSLRLQLGALGALGLTRLDPRPATPPHVVQHMLATAGLDPTADLPRGAFLRRTATPAQDTLWLHPGSGSPAKNAPLQAFVDAVEDRRPENVVLSFGPADADLIAPATEALGAWEPRCVINPSLTQLRRQLSTGATAYVGNDSGVSHLAAALGIPATVFFVHTNPAIWQPLGEAVTVVAPA
jgi:ADP-heptose:LPS heptosyltransferase